MKDLTIIIPSKNEPYLQNTVEDILDKSESYVEVLVGLDGTEHHSASWSDERVTTHQEVVPIGQRAMMNRLAEMANGKYIMKLDAHCSMGQGFDRILLENIQDNQIIAPLMLPLDAERWTVSPHNKMASFAFDTQLVNHHVATDNEHYDNKTMCLQGACFMTLTKNYWDWQLCDETLGSWGGQGVELGIQAYLHGGGCVTTKKTYFGHLFRHKENDFPYKRQQAEIDVSHQNVIKKLKTAKIRGLIEQFGYPLDWSKDECDKLK